MFDFILLCITNTRTLRVVAVNDECLVHSGVQIFLNIGIGIVWCKTPSILGDATFEMWWPGGEAEGKGV